MLCRGHGYGAELASGIVFSVARWLRALFSYDEVLIIFSDLEIKI